MLVMMICAAILVFFSGRDSFLLLGFLFLVELELGFFVSRVEWNGIWGLLHFWLFRCAERRVGRKALSLRCK